MAAVAAGLHCFADHLMDAVVIGHRMAAAVAAVDHRLVAVDVIVGHHLVIAAVADHRLAAIVTAAGHHCFVDLMDAIVADHQ